MSGSAPVPSPGRPASRSYCRSWCCPAYSVTSGGSVAHDHRLLFLLVDAPVLGAVQVRLLLQARADGDTEAVRHGEVDVFHLLDTGAVRPHCELRHARQAPAGVAGQGHGHDATL